jgi:hypothetical protein
MRVLWQPAETEARDFVELASTDWERIEAAPDKSPLTTPGAFVNSINVQGVVFDDADHYHVEHLPSGGARVWSWWDDPTIWAPLEFRARVVTLENLRPDPLLGGAWNTAQSEVWYGQPGGSVDIRFRGLGPWQSVTFKPWAAFFADLPAGNIVHGIMLPDPLWVAAQAARTMRGWREWTEGVDSKVIDPRTGKVSNRQALLGLRSPKTGTYTRYLGDGVGGIDGHSLDRELTTEESPITAGSLSMTTGKTTAATEAWGWNFGAGLIGGGTPGVHPNGLYQAQIDCTLNEGSHVYGIKTLNSVTGHFGIYNFVGASHTDSWEQTEGTHSGTGVKTCSRTLNPTDGDEFDLFQAICVIDHPEGHGGGDHVFTLELNEADDLIEGPWDAPSTHVTDEVGARIHGQVLGLGNERGGRIEGDGGVTNVTDEIGGRTHGIANIAAEIGARIQGVAQASAEVGGRIHGQAAAADEIGARIQGVASVVSEVGGRISGTDSAASEAGGRVHGIANIGDEVGGRIEGVGILVTDEIGGRIQGIAQSTDEIGARIQGVLNVSSEIGARIEGILGATGEIGGRLHGEVLGLADEIGGRVQGVLNVTAEIGSRIHGQANIADEIGARIEGDGGATHVTSEVGGRVHGAASDQAEIGARVQGVAQDSAEVGGRVHGIDQASSVRGARVEGLDAAQGEIGARIQGVRHTGPATSFQRGARIHGTASATAEIGARIEGANQAADEIGARIEGEASGAPPAERLGFIVIAVRRQNFEKMANQRRLEEEAKR